MQPITTEANLEYLVCQRPQIARHAAGPSICPMRASGSQHALTGAGAKVARTTPPQRRLDHLFNRSQSPRHTARFPPATPAYKTSPNIRRHLVFEKHLRLTFCQTRHEASPISGCVVSRLTEARWFQLASGWAAFSCKPGQRAMAMARPYPDANAGKRQ